MAGNDRAIPTAGPDFAHLLGQDVVIEAGNDDKTRTGAQREAPDHSPRAPATESLPATLSRLRERAGVRVDPALHFEVEQFLYRQAELLDAKLWQDFIDCFAEDGIYWMPVTPEQTEWEGSPSIFAEDRLMMEIRKGRVSHPNAWSQAPMWETNHLVSHIAVESERGGEIQVRSRFHMMELRRETVRHFGGSYRHTLVRDGAGELQIKVQRVDLFNSQAPFDYVLQVWV